MRRLLQAAGLAVLSLPAILVVCWPAPMEEAAPADSSRRTGPPDDPTRMIRKEPFDVVARVEGQDQLRRMRLQWRRTFEEAMKSPGRCGWQPPGRFLREWSSTLTEVRLFSLGYPELAERWAKEVLDSPEGPPGTFQGLDYERFRAFYALDTLWEQGWSGAEAIFLQRCQTRVSERWGDSLYLLANGDRSGKHLPLYRQRAREGDFSAIQPLTYWNDAESRRILNSTASNPKTTPWGFDLNASHAKELLPQAEALASGTWETLTRATILGEEIAIREHLGWALRITLERRPAWLEKALRERALRAQPREDQPLSFRDDAYDEVLIALARLGADLTGTERALLHRHGYLGDPRARLGEVLEEKNYPR